MKVIIKSEPVGAWSPTGVAWRAFREDGSPLYIGEPTREACERAVRDQFAWVKEGLVFEVKP